MYCHDLEVMSSSPDWAELWVRGFQEYHLLSFVLKEYDLLSAYFFMLFYFYFFLYCAFCAVQTWCANNL